MNSPFQKVGRCIYCDSTSPPLTREHVVARGLGGNRSPKEMSEAMVLLDASCEECREVTRVFEEDCLTNMLGPARARMNLNRKDRAKGHRKADIVYHDGREEEADLGISKLPAAMIIPAFPDAAIFMGLDWNPDVTFGVYQCVIEDHQRERDPDIHQIVLTLKCNFNAFARMLCKIALGFAHYTLGDGVFVPVTRDFIRFGRGHPAHFVGGYDNVIGEPEFSEGLHKLQLWHVQSLLVATIQLFASAGGPVNYAAIGWLRHMPRGLPPLPLGQPLPRPDKTPGPPPSKNPTARIVWDQIVP